MDKRINAPSLRSPVIDKQSMRLVDNFPQYDIQALHFLEYFHTVSCQVEMQGYLDHENCATYHKGYLPEKG